MQQERPSRTIRSDWLPRAIISGFIAAIAMLFTFMVAYGLAFLVTRTLPVASDRPAALIRDWFYGLTHNPLTDLAGINIYVVAGLHFAVAILWALLYARYAEPRLEGPAWLRGVAFSLLPWVLSITFLL